MGNDCIIIKMVHRNLEEIDENLFDRFSPIEIEPTAWVCIFSLTINAQKLIFTANE